MRIQYDVLYEKYSSLIESDFLTFNDVKSNINTTGVYIIYSQTHEILYVGSTNKFNIRFGIDLNHESTHTLMRKLLRNNVFPERLEARNYLINICKFKIEVCSTKREAEALEHFAIWILNPKYNK